MTIELKLLNKTYLFDDWKQDKTYTHRCLKVIDDSDKSWMWSRQLLAIDGLDISKNSDYNDWKLVIRRSGVRPIAGLYLEPSDVVPPQFYLEFSGLYRDCSAKHSTFNDPFFYIAENIPDAIKEIKRRCEVCCKLTTTLSVFA